MVINDLQRQQLIATALRVRQNAYAPYSNFLVGAAVLTESGAIVGGCNVENASYGLAICAERNALTSMVSGGERQVQALAVACSGAGSPCGACRQFMLEFGFEFEVILVDADQPSRTESWQAGDLLPRAFRLKR